MSTIQYPSLIVQKIHMYGQGYFLPWTELQTDRQKLDVHEFNSKDFKRYDVF